MEPKLSRASLMVLRALIENPSTPIAGSDLLQMTSVMSGTLYPMLMRLQRAGWLESEWEVLDPREAGRPRRRYYRLTDLGRRKAREALAPLSMPEGALAWAR
jgi:DNA-binding PadR family transcriptional regulator